MRKRFFVCLVLLLAIAGVLGWRYVTSVYIAPGPLAEVCASRSRAGRECRGVISQLGKRGVLADPRAVSLCICALHGLNPKIKAGTYDIPCARQSRGNPAMLEQGTVVLEQLTVVEGSTFADLRARAREASRPCSSLCAARAMRR